MCRSSKSAAARNCFAQQSPLIARSGVFTHVQPSGDFAKAAVSQDGASGVLADDQGAEIGLSPAPYRGADKQAGLHN